LNLPALYEIAETYRHALETLGDMELDDQTVRDTLEGLQGDLQVKGQNVAAFCLHLEAMSEAIRAAEQKMEHRRKVLSNRADNIRAYLKQCMETAGIQKIECPLFKLQIKKNPPKTVIDDEALIPAEFMKTPPPPPPVPDKKAIADFLKQQPNGRTDWAHQEQGTRISIE